MGINVGTTTWLRSTFHAFENSGRGRMSTKTPLSAGGLKIILYSEVMRSPLDLFLKCINCQSTSVCTAANRLRATMQIVDSFCVHAFSPFKFCVTLATHPAVVCELIHSVGYTNLIIWYCSPEKPYMYIHTVAPVNQLVHQHNLFSRWAVVYLTIILGQQGLKGHGMYVSL